MSSDAALNHSPSWSNSPYTAWRCVLGHCPVLELILCSRGNPGSSFPVAVLMRVSRFSTTTTTFLSTMASSKSSQTTRNIVIACLALWSVISLIIIVVWATSPDMKSASQCRAELQTLTEKHEGARVVYAKNKAALEEMVEEGRANQTRQLRETERLLERLGQTNVSLDDCQQENVILGGNITVLEKEIKMHKEIEANLTSEIMLNQEHIELLQENLTQASHKWASCVALHSAAESQRIAAESQTKACESGKLYLQKQLQKCKREDGHASEFLDDGVAAPQTSILALAMVLCVSLQLIT